MNVQDALKHLKYGSSLDCVTPEGRRFQIQSKLSYVIAFYRTRPITQGCLNRYSRLSDSEVLEWLSRLPVVQKVG